MVPPIKARPSRQLFAGKPDDPRLDLGQRAHVLVACSSRPPTGDERLKSAAATLTFVRWGALRCHHIPPVCYLCVT